MATLNTVHKLLFIGQIVFALNDMNRQEKEKLVQLGKFIPRFDFLNTKCHHEYFFK